MRSLPQLWGNFADRLHQTQAVAFPSISDLASSEDVPGLTTYSKCPIAPLP
ncbi:MAG: hypothetical protein QQW96_06300 [Tychonema bourrellyi B0820]|nr:hypothetical protein [Tychonema bourrellyi B0820]